MGKRSKTCRCGSVIWSGLPRVVLDLKQRVGLWLTTCGAKMELASRQHVEFRRPREVLLRSPHVTQMLGVRLVQMMHGEQCVQRIAAPDLPLFAVYAMQSK